MDTPPLFDELWFKLLIGLIVGLALGSFTTMLSYRLPKRLSIVKPDSHCPSCKTPLQPRDLVPVLSWILMKGKCRYCGVSIGARYVWIEIATGILSAVAFGAIGFRPVLTVLLCGNVAVVTFVTMKIEQKDG